MERVRRRQQDRYTDERDRTPVCIPSLFSRKWENRDSNGDASICHEEIHTEQEALCRRAIFPWRLSTPSAAVDEP